MNLILNTNVNISYDLFKKPMVNKQMQKVYEEMKFEIKQRIEEINAYIFQKYNVTLSKTTIIGFWEIELKKFILSEAITKLTIGEEGYNIIKVLISSANKEIVKKAIYGEVMIDSIIASMAFDIFLEDTEEFLELSEEEFKKELMIEFCKN